MSVSRRFSSRGFQADDKSMTVAVVVDDTPLILQRQSCVCSSICEGAWWKSGNNVMGRELGLCYWEGVCNGWKKVGLDIRRSDWLIRLE